MTRAAGVGHPTAAGDVDNLGSLNLVQMIPIDHAPGFARQCSRAARQFSGVAPFVLAARAASAAMFKPAAVRARVRLSQLAGGSSVFPELKTPPPPAAGSVWITGPIPSTTTVRAGGDGCLFSSLLFSSLGDAVVALASRSDRDALDFDARFAPRARAFAVFPLCSSNLGNVRPPSTSSNHPTAIRASANPPALVSRSSNARVTPRALPSIVC
uniref:Uncharacterized protein n=1 Tax=uncultured marine virus TaxID=186617 RepID=A0A0F7LA82_9VIRU|nr:hypothetical protein TK90_1231 [uncultured marine virus]